MKKLLITLLIAATAAHGAIITFTGGTVEFFDETLENQITNGKQLFGGVSRYEENGFFLEYVMFKGSQNTWGQNVGNYYGESENDVIHGHWPEQPGNGLDYIKIGKIDGGLFDLEYFALTSNTEIGGGHATGNEKVYIQGFKSNNRALWETEKYLIPGNNWGIDETYNVFLGDDFNEIEYATISGSDAFCFGMDQFTFDETAIAIGDDGINLTTGDTGPSIPEPSTSALMLAFGSFMYAAIRRRRVT